MSRVHVSMSTNSSQVSVPLASNISAADCTFVCPVASNFLDTYGGLYGNNSFQSISRYCDSYGLLMVLTSSLEFTCEKCGPGLYSLASGNSTGEPGNAYSPPCLPCPSGGVCSQGSVVPRSGYWGAANAKYGPRVERRACLT